MTQLSTGERQAITSILNALSQQRRDSLLADLASATVLEAHDNRSVITFALPDYERPSPGQMPLEVEGMVKDEDGQWIEVLVYDDANGRLYEFELIRVAEGGVRNPDWSSFRLNI